MTFCNDSDLLYWEPAVLQDANFVSQTLAKGEGAIAGAVFTASSGPSFVDQQISAGQVIALSGPIAGALVITAVNSATELAVSALYTELFPVSGPAPNPLAVDQSGLTYAIRTFYAQRKIVSDFLLAAVGCENASFITNPDSLKRACVLGTLQMVYSAIYAAASVEDAPRLGSRAALYERFYRRALRAAQVDVDLNGDGRADTRRSPGLLRLTRA